MPPEPPTSTQRAASAASRGDAAVSSAGTLLGPSPLERGRKVFSENQGNFMSRCVGGGACFKPHASCQAPNSWHCSIRAHTAAGSRGPSPRAVELGRWRGCIRSRSLLGEQPGSREGSLPPAMSLQGPPTDQDLPADKGKLIKGPSFLLQVRARRVAWS